MIRFGRDPEKAKLDLQKHRVSFAEAARRSSITWNDRVGQIGRDRPVINT
jgi:hypothetical protein